MIFLFYIVILICKYIFDIPRVPKVVLVGKQVWDLIKEYSNFHVFQAHFKIIKRVNETTVQTMYMLM